jgi:cell division transport system ATP-binding protein
MSQKVIELKSVSVYQPIGAVTVLDKSNYQRSGELVLSDVNLDVYEGEMVYFIGRVGSGKSSLLKTLYAEMPLLQGEAMVAGFDLAKMKSRNIPMLRRRLGIVFQDYRLLTDRNVFDNLYFMMQATGWKSDSDMRQRIDELLTSTGLQHKAYKMPYELSGGQQQKLAIARALINRPSVLLADEPTGNLDPTAADEVMMLFYEIVKSGCAVVMSTHNIANIGQFPSRTIRFAQGRAEEIDINAILAMN